MSSESKLITSGVIAGTFAAAAMAVAPSFAAAQEDVAAQPRTAEYSAMDEEIAPINDGNWSFELTLDVVTAYWFRGISQGPSNDRGFIPQLGASAEVLLFEEEDFSVSYFLGTWNSFTSSNASGSAGSGWYESDLYTGFSVGLPHGFSAGISYVLLYGPSAGGEFAQEIDIELAYDDSAIMEDAGVPFSLAPYVLFVFETSGGSDGGTPGGYFEAGIEPSFVVLESEEYPVTLSVPVTIGLNMYDYYEFGTGSDDLFGFLDIGLVAGVPLTMIPAEYGAWDLSAGVHFTILGENNRKFSGGNGTGNESIQVWGIIGLAMTY